RVARLLPIRRRGEFWPCETREYLLSRRAIGGILRCGDRRQGGVARWALEKTHRKQLCRAPCSWIAGQNSLTLSRAVAAGRQSASSAIGKTLEAGSGRGECS